MKTITKTDKLCNDIYKHELKTIMLKIESNEHLTLAEQKIVLYLLQQAHDLF